ncbi:methyltransferase domain-containing protein [Hymenobacter fodinae]|uniref:Methyltransferase domain-containing protein n=1 Tax=Hymenobacter fodinae TaxID=2510796 RepID=A0A4Z0PAJ1_9BACT|nr:methyltransferase domain-containing protein [Hymenobacter fodinae]
MRKPLQGVGNILRFNWHFYALAAGSMVLVGASRYVWPAWGPWALLLLAAIGVTVGVSLLVSFYVYDVSNLYSLQWLPERLLAPAGTVVNIHAGFDETSALLQQRFESSPLVVLDFYDPQLHTEVSIRRARAAYAAYPGTQRVQTHALPLADNSADCVFLLLAAHEVRHPRQREAFLREVHRVLRPAGKLVVVEHLRDAANFAAYTVGFLHFYSRKTWQRAFAEAGLTLAEEKKITPFVSAFILKRDGSAA